MAKNTLKFADIAKKTPAELNQRLAEINQELFNLRFQLATRQLSDTSKVKKVKLEKTWILTALNSKNT
jgi:large subunit ribosomal protein L29